MAYSSWTNNGKLAHAMLSPKKHVDKVYCAQVAGHQVTQEDVVRFKEGIELKGFHHLTAGVGNVGMRRLIVAWLGPHR